MRVLTHDAVEKLIAYHQDGESTYALARRFGINRHTVSEHLHRSTLSLQSTTPAVSDQG